MSGRITAKFSGATLADAVASEVKASPSVASAGTRCYTLFFLTSKVDVPPDFNVEFGKAPHLFG